MPKKPKHDNPLLKAFGEVVRASRYRLNLSQQELANRAGFHLTYIGDLELGGRNIALLNLARLSLALEMPPEKLLKLWIEYLKKENSHLTLELYFSEEIKKRKKT